jgi:hydroxypyruvate isomerase
VRPPTRLDSTWNDRYAGLTTQGGVSGEGTRVDRSSMQYIAMVESIAGMPQYQFLWRELPLEQRIPAAASAGFHGVDFWDWIDKDMDRLAEVARASGIFLNSVFAWRHGSLSDAADHDLILDQLDQSLEMAARCGVRALFVQTDEVGAGGQVVPASRRQTDDERWAELEDGLRKVAERVKNSRVDVDLWIEPLSKLHVFGYLLRRVEDADALVQRVGYPRLKVVFDLFHQQINEGNLLNNLRAIVQRVGAIHIADAPHRGAPGSGEINIANIYQEILALGYCGPLGFECVPGDRSTAAVLQDIRTVFPIGNQAI